MDKALSLIFFAPIARGIQSYHSVSIIPILMYHHIDEYKESVGHPYFWINTHPQIFKLQMAFLKEKGYRVIPLSQAVEWLRVGPSVRDRRESPKYVAITFDDGYRDFLIYAFPILKHFGFTASVFISTAYIADRSLNATPRNYLSWDEVKMLSRHGISFGSHTVDHIQLKGLSRKKILYQIQRSKEAMEEKMNQPVDSFSYPYAFPEEDTEFTEFLSHSLHACGYRYGVSTRIGRASPNDPIFFLRRLPINSRDNISFFKAKLDGGYDWMHPVQKLSKIIRGKIFYGRKTKSLYSHLTR
jgi:peptidoglycan/xylan/chitin deacetylase (PgdA/CDA1 family)